MDDRDEKVVAALRAGDEVAFRDVVNRIHPTLVSIARRTGLDHAAAEEAAQEAWLIAIRGLDRFEGRSSLRTWLIGICLNIARRSAQTERRSSPADPVAPTVDPSRFQRHGRWAGHWADDVRPWTDPTAEDFLAGEAAALALAVIERLPSRQRDVIVLRDVEGLTPTETAELLDISAANQRVLLHRARSAVRTELERQLSTKDAA